MKKLIIIFLVACGALNAQTAYPYVQRDKLLTSGRVPFITTNGIVSDVSTLAFNSGTGALSATSFVGSLSGTATNATNVAITNDTTTNATMFPLWVTANTGNLPAKVTSTKLSFNPSTGILNSTGFIGTINGNTITTGSSTFTGTAGQTYTFPSTTATIARTDAGQTFTGVQAFTSPSTATSITTASTSFTAWAGATTLLTIGGTGASASLFAPSTLDTTSSTTGAIRTSGGISAAKSAHFGANLTVNGVSGLGVATSSTTALNLPASTTGVSSLRLAHGAAPTSPVNGDMWSTTAGFFGRVNGVTVGPFGTGGGGSGTVTVVGAGSLTSTALVTGGGTTTIQTPSATATLDSSGNISTPGSVSIGTAATTAGAISLAQGTTQATGTTNITIQAPAAVTSYIRTLPGSVGSTGFLLETVSGSVQTESLVPFTGSNNVVRSTAPSVDGTITYGGTSLLTPNAIGALSIDVTKELNTKSVSTANTFTFSATPTTNQWFGLEITNTDTSARIQTIPSSFSVANQQDITTIEMAPSTTYYLLWRYTGSRYLIYGDPTLVGSSISSAIPTGSAVTLSSNTAANVTSISLTPGTWAVTGAVYFKPAAANSSLFETSINTTSATVSTTVPQFTSIPIVITANSAVVTQNIPMNIITVASNTTYYLVARQTFSAGSSAAFGSITALRIK